MTPRFDLIGLAVADMAASLAFYRHLGLDLPPEADTEPHVEVTLPGGLRMAWDRIDNIRSFDPDWVQPEGGNRIGIAFLCDSPEGVDAMHAELTAAGYQSHKKPWDAFWGQRYATVLDPDGNSVDLFAPLPKAS
jgi:catechol 2,3-dioxygenase-like lactoylglutathione lyase family enzyme